MECNCSLCRRRGGLLAFVPRAALTLLTPEAEVSTYRFNQHAIDHHFCAHCGIAAFGEGKSRGGSGQFALSAGPGLPDDSEGGRAEFLRGG